MTPSSVHTVSVTDFGAKDFQAPVEVQLHANHAMTAIHSCGNLSVGDTVRVIDGEAERRPHKVRLTVHSLPSTHIKVYFSLYYSSSGRYDIDPADTVQSLVDKMITDTRLNQYWHLTRVADDTLEAESKAPNNLTPMSLVQLYGIAAYQADETYDGTWTVTTLQVGSCGQDLTAQITAIDGNRITLDKPAGSTILSTVYIDSTQAFQDAFAYANEHAVDVLIPEGRYFVDGGVTVQTNVRCLGQIVTSNKGNTPLFSFTRRETGITIDGTRLSGSLQQGTTYIPELAAYPGHDVIFDSTERIIWRNNNAKQYYPKREANRTGEDGALITGLMESYHDKSLLKLTLYKREKPIQMDGLNVFCIRTISQKGKSILLVRRSDVVFDNLCLDNETLDTKEGQNTGIGIADAVEIQINSSNIRGFMLDGYGYPVLVSRTLFVRLNHTHISYARHAVAGNADHFTIITGGSYEGYSGTLDSHWGHDLTVKDALIRGPIVYAGVNLTISGSTLITGSSTLIGRRMDAPSLSGSIDIKDCKVVYTGTADFNFYIVLPTDFKHDAPLWNPNLVLENVELELAHDISRVHLYAVQDDVTKTWMAQSLPETLRVKNLRITGQRGKKLTHTCLNAQVSHARYTMGSPTITIDGVSVHK